MNYWLNLFTGATWQPFRQKGCVVCGFSHYMRGMAKRIMPQDVLLCYLTGVMRWVGAVEIISGPTEGPHRDWNNPDFPVVFLVKPLVVLSPEHGVPMEQLEGKVDFFSKPEHRGNYNQFLRRCPNLFRKPEDGPFVLNLLRQAESNPVSRPVSAAKLNRKRAYTSEISKAL